ncbi:hypothetical protein Kpol_529p10 [Vanderwaltozyma polyspora DSM 70294]|uniref:Septin-type G domain-containing protein n=1 Tax=Vanderwaltozyma polyspora (strain ATCC 22028 / DSM 70294 / BCRC 21397 / CBS 2163 / NBRC 10782 / NRRL Y-8283 / UCD 57-17) TaxID=436907 RepID=A7TM63_VANPO|nr:uncharacterized protein Kpol_529p10 [Vanderwaltozyma polyspora DSM 70294]EDO16630.1 hypothetical protein Kpol_529p10 [Vanderwaltozyma polyspora DSM 70294]
MAKFNTEEIRLRKNAKKGTQLCLLMLGSKGTGKSTFLNNLCGRKIFPTLQQKESLQDPSHAHISPTVKVIKETINLDEGNGVTITLDVVLFPGAGDNLDDTKTPALVREYLETQFDHILNEEIQIKRRTRDTDPRPHICLYFIKPTARGLKAIDIEMMKEIGNHVNIIPVLSKVDTLTEEELSFNKHLIMEDIERHGIRLFDFKEDTLGESIMTEDDLDRSYPNIQIQTGPKINHILPFGIACSNEVTDTNGSELSHIIKFEWGQVIVEDVSTSEFMFLKGILLGSHIQDFKDFTNDVLYENHRTRKLLGNKGYANFTAGIISSSNEEVASREGMGFKTDDGGNISPVSNKTTRQGTSVLNKELEEKNRIIEAYQRKISELETMINAKNVKKDIGNLIDTH